MNTPEQRYQQRQAAFAAQRDHYARQSSRAANLNIALFVAALICLALGFGRLGTPLLVAAALFGLAFAVSFVRHGRIDVRQRRFAGLVALSDEGLWRLRRDWQQLPLRQRAPADPDHPYAADLDLGGHASLLHLLGASGSPAGQRALRAWLLAPAAPALVVRRQHAVAELAPQIDLRDELALQGRSIAADEPAFQRFRSWADDQPWVTRQPWLLWAARLLPLASLALAAAQALGLTAYPLAALPLAASALLTFTLGREADARIDGVAVSQESLRAYAELFALIGQQPWAADELRDIQQRLRAGNLRADQQLRRLGALMPLAAVRGWMFFLPIQIATLWNIHLLWLLERWRTAAGTHVGPWLDAVGDLEALAALATLCHDQPGWCFPEVDAAAPRLEAQALGHPLLSDADRVGNDVAVGPAGTFLLITGSNMAGKSTLLRAIGLNVVLAQAGAPACAHALRLPPLALATSMRVQDSLARGVSFFMAELQRLKAVVVLAEQTRAEGRLQLLFLLDEILQGTNTAERQIAARHIVQHLLALGASGAVSTHDLALADSPDLVAVSQRFYFNEQFSRSPAGLQMSFDYQLRPGVAPTTNALKLMELVGLPPVEQASAS